ANGTEWSRRSSTASARSRRVSATSTTRRSHRIRPRCSSGTRRSRPRAPTWTGCTRAGRSWRPSRPDTPEWTRSRGSVKKMRPTRASSLRWVCLAVALTLGVPRAGFAEEPLTAKAPAKTLSWETGEGHSYFIPAFEIAAFAERQHRERYRRVVRRRGAVPHGQPAARGRRRDARLLARARSRGDLAADRLQPSRLRRSVRRRLSEPQPGDLHPPAARRDAHDRHRHRRIDPRSQEV